MPLMSLLNGCKPKMQERQELREDSKGTTLMSQRTGKDHSYEVEEIGGTTSDKKWKEERVM